MTEENRSDENPEAPDTGELPPSPPTTPYGWIPWGAAGPNNPQAAGEESSSVPPPPPAPPSPPSGAGAARPGATPANPGYGYGAGYGYGYGQRPGQPGGYDQPGYGQAGGYGHSGSYGQQASYGHPGQPGGPGTPGGQWTWGSPPPQPPRKPGRHILTFAVVAALLIVALSGVIVGHDMWHGASSATGNSPSTGTNGGTTNPFGNFGTNPFSGNSGSSGSGSNGNGAGSGSSASGSPSDAAAIAHRVDPGLVDVNTTLSYAQAEAAGTGMVITSNGLVLTNNHVVEGATSISVTDVGNGHTYGATVVGYDRTEDVAVLQLTGASGLQTVNLGDSSTVGTGEGVVAIGNAGGSGGTPSYAGGSITALNQSISASDELSGTSEQLSGLLETNADVIAGDSGGPLVNSSGDVVGMDTAGSSSFQIQSGPSQGYAIPINEALATMHEITGGQRSTTVHIGLTAFLGVEVQSTNGTSGAVIASVVNGDPAANAGLVGGDVITSVNGQNVTSPDSLTTVMTSLTPNQTVSVGYTNTNGQHQTVNVTLGSGPPQ